MTVRPRSDIQPKCVELCAMANSCAGIDPLKAVALAKHLTDRPYGGCAHKEGPTLQTNGTEQCHLDREVQAALGGIAAGISLATGETVTIPLPRTTIEPRELVVAMEASVDLAPQLDGYLRLNA